MLFKTENFRYSVVKQLLNNKFNNKPDCVWCLKRITP